jgi:hypothetical protein
MTPVTYFRASLLLPIAAPLALLPFGMNAVAAILLMSLGFGGIQYVIFAAFLFWWIGRLKTPRRIRRLSLIAPLCFVPVQAAGWVIYGYLSTLSIPGPTGIWNVLPAFAVYTLVIGYVYVGIVNLLYAIFFRNHETAQP